MLLDSNTACEVLGYAKSRGATFAELFVERDNRNQASILSSRVHQLNSGIDFGVGVRLLFGSEVLYGYTNSTKKEELMELVKKLAAHRQASPRELVKLSLRAVEAPSHQITTVTSAAQNLQDPLDFMLEIDRRARLSSDKLSQVQISMVDRLQEVEIFNTEGLHVQDRRPYHRYSVLVIAEDKGEQSTGYTNPGIMGNLNEFRSLYQAEKLAKEAVEQALITLGAAHCPAGKMPVVLSNAFGGVIFHEACGHLLETTSVAKKASVFHDKMGEQIANSVVNAVDDGTIAGSWGSIAFDDEGAPTQKTQLIKDGKLTSFLVDRVGSLKTDYAETGSGRRQSYRFAPASRMRNTYIEAGNDSFEDMIRSVDKGIYCASLGGGSVSPGTGEFNFAAVETYLIENGKITKPVKGATLIGKGPEVLKQISMVGDNLVLAAGMCGSVSGAVPVTVGQPALKIDQILVGGRA